MALDVVVVGSAVRDEYYELSNLPEPDGGAYVRGRETAVGGVAANVAVALSRLGRDVGLVARVGERDAATIVGHLEAEGVDTARLRRGEEAPTYSLVLRGGAGERMVVTGGAATERLRLSPDDLDYCGGADVVFTSAYAPDPVVRALLDADGPPLAFDLPGPLAELRNRGAEPATVDRAVATVDLFIAGAVATRDYLGCPPIDGIDRLGERGVERAALTAGVDGSYLLDRGRTLAVPAFDVSAVDTTGAGDAFTAGLLDAWVLDGHDSATAGRFASAVAALGCLETTAQAGLPTRAEVRAFLGSRPG